MFTCTAVVGLHNRSSTPETHARAPTVRGIPRRDEDRRTAVRHVALRMHCAAVCMGAWARCTGVRTSRVELCGFRVSLSFSCLA